jgi:hypothetical protein
MNFRACIVTIYASQWIELEKLLLDIVSHWD